MEARWGIDYEALSLADDMDRHEGWVAHPARRWCPNTCPVCGDRCSKYYGHLSEECAHGQRGQHKGPIRWIGPAVEPDHELAATFRKWHAARLAARARLTALAPARSALRPLAEQVRLRRLFRHPIPEIWTRG